MPVNKTFKIAVNLEHLLSCLVALAKLQKHTTWFPEEDRNTVIQFLNAIQKATTEKQYSTLEQIYKDSIPYFLTCPLLASQSILQDFTESFLEQLEQNEVSTCRALVFRSREFLYSLYTLLLLAHSKTIELTETKAEFVLQFNNRKTVEKAKPFMVKVQ